MESLTMDQFNLYKLIYLRFLSSQMNPAVFETMTADIVSDRVSFRFYSEKKTFAGFTACYEEGVDDKSDEETAVASNKTPRLEQGMAVTLAGVASEQHFTAPPPRFTEASLVRALEEKGIGRPSTYAPTISTIIARGYVLREKSRLAPTELGRMVTSMMCEYFKNIVDEKFTSDMESKLDHVEENEIPWKNVIRGFYGGFAEDLKVAEETIEKIPEVPVVSDIQCENCGAMMIYRHGRFGKFLACPNFPACRNTKPVLVFIDTPCPACGKRLVEKISKKGGKFYACEGYPDCQFVAFDYPVTDRCGECGSPMVLKENRKGQRFHVCMNEKCRHRDLLENNDEETAEETVDEITEEAIGEE
jgi:DNA topoisomerase-1